VNHGTQVEAAERTGIGIGQDCVADLECLGRIEHTTFGKGAGLDANRPKSRRIRPSRAIHLAVTEPAHRPGFTGCGQYPIAGAEIFNADFPVRRSNVSASNETLPTVSAATTVRGYLNVRPNANRHMEARFGRGRRILL